MTDGILSTIKDWTGADYKGGCPWMAFHDPLVRDVLAAWPFFENGTLALYLPDPPHRVMEGLRVFSRARDACAAEKARLDAEAAKRGRRPS